IPAPRCHARGRGVRRRARGGGARPRAGDTQAAVKSVEAADTVDRIVRLLAIPVAAREEVVDRVTRRAIAVVEGIEVEAPIGPAVRDPAVGPDDAATRREAARLELAAVLRHAARARRRMAVVGGEALPVRVLVAIEHGLGRGRHAPIETILDLNRAARRARL